MTELEKAQEAARRLVGTQEFFLHLFDHIAGPGAIYVIYCEGAAERLVREIRPYPLYTYTEPRHGSWKRSPDTIWRRLPSDESKWPETADRYGGRISTVLRDQLGLHALACAVCGKWVRNTALG